MRKIIITSLVMGGLVAMLSNTLQAADGKDLFQKKMCAACHAPGKKGGDLKDSKMDKATIAKFMKDPKGANPKATMPAFKGSDEELDAIADYVISLRK